MPASAWIAIVMQFGAIVWFASQLDGRVSALEGWKSQYLGLSAQLARIEVKLEGVERAVGVAQPERRR